MPADDNTPQSQPAATPLVYVDTVPTVEGWYWRRWTDGGVLQSKVVHLPHMGVWPKDWRVLREESLKVVDEEMREQLLALPEASWRVEFAGPIAAPIN